MTIFKKKKYNIYFFENIIKNILILLLIAILWSPIRHEIRSIKDVEILKTILIFVGLIIIAPLFGVYGFSYQHTYFPNFIQRLISHITAALVMFISAILLVMIDELFVQLVRSDAYIFRSTLLLFYISVIFYDFWDFFRVWKSEK